MSAAETSERIGPAGALRWWMYVQNRSGNVTYGPALAVFVSETDGESADAIAEAHGVDFNEAGCSCCGRPWSEALIEEDGRPMFLDPYDWCWPHEIGERIARVRRLFDLRSHPRGALALVIRGDAVLRVD